MLIHVVVVVVVAVVVVEEYILWILEEIVAVLI